MTPTTILGVELLTALLVKGLPLTLVVAAGGLVLRRGPARTRSIYWALSGVALVLLPFLSLGLPGWGGGMIQFPVGLTTPAESAPSLAGWVATIWAAGVLLFAGRLLGDLGRVYAVGWSASRVVDPSLRRAARRAREQLGLRRSVQLRISDAGPVPSTYGCTRPVVLLPTRAATWPEERVRSVLLHEMAHVARHDFLALVVVEVTRVLLWPNPLAWYLADRVRKDQEMACDAAVVRSAVGTTTYARQLVAVAREMVAPEAASNPALPVVGTSDVGERVRHVLELDRGEDSGRSARGWRRAILVGVALVLLGVAALEPWSPCTAAPVDGSPSAETAAAVIDDTGAGPRR